MQKYIVVYLHDGAEYTLQIPAKSFDDARSRLMSLSLGKIVGEVVSTYPADGNKAKILPAAPVVH